MSRAEERSIMGSTARVPEWAGMDDFGGTDDPRAEGRAEPVANAPKRRPITRADEAAVRAVFADDNDLCARIYFNDDRIAFRLPPLDSPRYREVEEALARAGIRPGPEGPTWEGPKNASEYDPIAMQCRAEADEPRWQTTAVPRLDGQPITNAVALSGEETEALRAEAASLPPWLLSAVEAALPPDGTPLPFLPILSHARRAKEAGIVNSYEVEAALSALVASGVVEAGPEADGRATWRRWGVPEGWGWVEVGVDSYLQRGQESYVATARPDSSWCVWRGDQIVTHGTGETSMASAKRAALRACWERDVFATAASPAPCPRFTPASATATLCVGCGRGRGEHGAAPVLDGAPPAPDKALRKLLLAARSITGMSDVIAFDERAADAAERVKGEHSAAPETSREDAFSFCPLHGSEPSDLVRLRSAGPVFPGAVMMTVEDEGSHTATVLEPAELDRMAAEARRLLGVEPDPLVASLLRTLRAYLRAGEPLTGTIERMVGDANRGAANEARAERAPAAPDADPIGTLALWLHKHADRQFCSTIAPVDYAIRLLEEQRRRIGALESDLEIEREGAAAGREALEALRESVRALWAKAGGLDK